MTGLEEKLKEAILTIGRNLPVGMEIHFYREDGCERPRMQIVYPDGTNTEYAVLQSSPLPLQDVALALMFERTEQLQVSLRACLMAMKKSDIECFAGESCTGTEWDDAVEFAEHLLVDQIEVSTDSVDTSVFSVLAIASYPMGSMGEAVELEGGA
jgi:hypothetical protein